MGFYVQEYGSLIRGYVKEGSSMKRLMLGLSALFLCGCVHISVDDNLDYVYPSAEKYVEYTAPVELPDLYANLKEVHIDWVNGDVKIQKGEKLTITETNGEGEYRPLYYLAEGNALTVRFWKSGVYNLTGKYDKKLVVTVPENLLLLQLDIVSATYQIDLSNVDKVEIDSVTSTGEVNLSSCPEFIHSSVTSEMTLNASSIVNLDLNTLSGENNVNLDKLVNASFNAVSSSFNLVVKDSSDLSKIDIDTTSGSASLSFDGKRGYDLSFDTVSGKKNLAFTEGSDASSSKFSIDFSSTSGNLDVKKTAE